jgi:N-acyl-D-amino-acid deacylase
VPVVISHHKCSGRANWGRSVQTLKMIEQANGITPSGLDMYPYAASSTVLMPELMDDQLRTLITWSEAAPEMAGQDLQEYRRTVELHSTGSCRAPAASGSGLLPDG